MPRYLGNLPNTKIISQIPRLLVNFTDSQAFGEFPKFPGVSNLTIFLVAVRKKRYDLRGQPLTV